MTSGGGELVFVYGTLRRGASNHFRMEGSRHLAVGTIVGRIYRIDWYPGLVLEGGGARVSGEVYEVGARLLADLDDFEGVSVAGNQSEYRRVKTEVACEDGRCLVAWVWEWLGRTEGLAWLPDGDWLAAKDL